MKILGSNLVLGWDLGFRFELESCSSRFPAFDLSAPGYCSCQAFRTRLKLATRSSSEEVSARGLKQHRSSKISGIEIQIWRLRFEFEFYLDVNLTRIFMSEAYDFQNRNNLREGSPSRSLTDWSWKFEFGVYSLKFEGQSLKVEGEVYIYISIWSLQSAFVVWKLQCWKLVPEFGSEFGSQPGIEVCNLSLIWPGVQKRPRFSRWVLLVCSHKHLKLLILVRVVIVLLAYSLNRDSLWSELGSAWVKLINDLCTAWNFIHCLWTKCFQSRRAWSHTMALASSKTCCKVVRAVSKVLQAYQISLLRQPCLVSRVTLCIK